MTAFQIFLAIVLMIAGILLFKHGQCEPTAEEDTSRDHSFFHEFLYGPTGYERIRGLIGGIVLMIAGVGLLLYSIRILF